MNLREGIKKERKRSYKGPELIQLRSPKVESILLSRVDKRRVKNERVRDGVSRKKARKKEDTR